MERSEQIGDLVAALAKAQKAFTSVPKSKTAKVKTKTGGEYQYKYADLADVLSMAIPRLSDNNLAFSQPHILRDGKLRVVSMLLHPSGQWMQSDGIEISEDGDPQQFGAESTYFRRYDACSLLGIAPDEDTDAQQAGNRQRRTTEAPSVPPSAASRQPGATAEDFQEWHDEFAAAETVHEFNRAMIPLVKKRGSSFVAAVKTEAKRRGYKPNRATGLYEASGATAPMYQDEIPTVDEYEQGYAERGGK